jgi:hypothetical protein
MQRFCTDRRLETFLASKCAMTTWAGDASDAIEVQDTWHEFVGGDFTEALCRLERRCVQRGPVYECEGMFVQLRPQVNV